MWGSSWLQPPTSTDADPAGVENDHTNHLGPTSNVATSD